MSFCYSLDADTMIAALALVVSIWVFMKQQSVTSPYCRIKASSHLYDFHIRVENVGTGVMKVKHVYFVKRSNVSSDIQKNLADYPFQNNELRVTWLNNQVLEKLESISYKTENLTAIFRDEVYGNNVIERPYSYQSGVNLNGDDVFPQSVHYIIRARYTSMDALMKAWKFTEGLDVYIHYVDVNNREFIKKSDFVKEYNSFMSAMDGRTSFKKDKEYATKQFPRRLKDGYYSHRYSENTIDFNANEE